MATKQDHVSSDGAADPRIERRAASSRRSSPSAAIGPSFAYQAHRTYNFFDEWLLGALPHSTAWRAALEGANRGVRRMEHALGVLPSEPQAYFGSSVTALKLGF